MADFIVKHGHSEQEPKSMPFINRVVDKGQLKKLIARAFTEYGTSRAAHMADELKTLGFRFATQAGVSISVDDLQVPPVKKELLEKAEDEIERTETRYTRGEITEVERFQKVIDTWNQTNEKLKDAVVDNFRTNNPLNSVYMMAFSGARGNISQVRQLVGMRGLMADPQGQIIDLPIKTNFREGLTVTEYIISSYGARKGLVDTALRTADSGYLTRRLVDVSQDVIVREVDCGTTRGIRLRDMRDGDRITIKLADRLFGRVLARAVLDPRCEAITLPLPLTAEQAGTLAVEREWLRKQISSDEIAAIFSEEDGIEEILVDEAASKENTRYYWVLTEASSQKLALAGVKEAPLRAIVPGAHRNADINETLAKRIVGAGVKEVFVRSALTCESTRSVCQMCYGWSLAHAQMVDIGEAVGIIAAQSIGEPGTQLTMRTFHTGGVFTGEVAQQQTADFDGTIKFSKKLRLRPMRTRHGDDAFIAENNGEFTLEAAGKKESKTITVTQGSTILVRDGQKVVKDELLAEVAAAGRTARKTTEKATKDVNTDLAGEVLLPDLVPEEKRDRQGNTSYIASRGGLIWVLAGEVYNLPTGAEPVVRNGERVAADSVLAETKLVTEHGGVVRLGQEDTRNGREIEIITASVILRHARVEEEISQGREHYILVTKGGQRFSLKAAPGTKVTNNQVVAELIDDTYHTTSGGIVKFSGELEVSKRSRGKQGYEVVKGGTLLWIPEETHEVNKDITLLKEGIEDGVYIEAGTEVVKDIFCQVSGVVEIAQKNDILREITVKPGELHLVDDPEAAMRKGGTLVPAGEEILPGIVVDALRYVEYVETPEGPAILLRPVQEFEVLDEPPVPSQEESTNQAGRGIKLRAVQRIQYKDGDRVKSVDGVELLRTQLVLEIDSDAPQLAADIEFVPDESDASSLRLQLVILESLLVRQDVTAELTQGATRTRILVSDGDRINPGAVVARTEILCKQAGEVRGIREGVELVRRVLVVTDEDCQTVACQNPQVKVGDLLRAGDPIDDKTSAPISGQVVAVGANEVTMRLGRPYLVSPGAVLQVGASDLVQRGDILALLVFERAKTGDIIQGLPRIEELLEARKPKEMCVLAQRPGTVQVSYDSDGNPEVKVLQDNGTLLEYPIGLGQSLIVSDGQSVRAAEPLTDGPANPHDILDIYFQVYRETLGTREAALLSLQHVQEFLVNEVQSVYQSQGVDISDKHIEVVVKQMTSKVRIDDGGDTTRLPGELVDLYQVEQINEAMAITGGTPAEYTPILMGITKASLNTDSFISAASFQETTRVLTEAAIEGKSDWLRGLKENVIIGRLIPAGTGFNAYDGIVPEIEEDEEEFDTAAVLEDGVEDLVIDDRTARSLDRTEAGGNYGTNGDFDADELVDDNSEFDEDDKMYE